MSLTGHAMMFHIGLWHAYTSIAVVYLGKNTAYFITTNGQRLRGNPLSTIYPISWLVSDILLGEKRWTNSSDVCQYPRPRKRKPLGSSNWISEGISKEYVGRYGHLLYGNIYVFYRNNILMVNLTDLVSATLWYTDTAKDALFKLEVHGKIGRVIDDRNPLMKFGVRKESMYGEVELIAEDESFLYKREVDFNGGSHTHFSVNQCVIALLIFMYEMVRLQI